MVEAGGGKPSGSDDEVMMEEMNELTRRRSRRPWVVAAAAVAICAIVYFSYPGSPPAGNASATIGVRSVEHITSMEGAGGGRTISDGRVTSAASDSTARRLRATAQALGLVAQDVASNNSVIGLAMVPTLARAAAETDRAAQAVLDGQIVMDANVMSDLLQRSTALRHESLALLSSGKAHEEHVADSIRLHARELERNSLACQPALASSAVSEISRAAASLTVVARSLELEEKSDTGIMADLHRMAFELDRASHLVERGVALDRVALASLVQQAREIELESSALLKLGPARVRAKLAQMERLSAAINKQVASIQQNATLAAGREE